MAETLPATHGCGASEQSDEGTTGISAITVRAMLSLLAMLAAAVGMARRKRAKELRVLVTQPVKRNDSLNKGLPCLGYT